jgi:hypothetical protein
MTGAGVAYALLVALWLGLLIPTISDAPGDEQLRALAASPTVYSLSMINASLISIPTVVMMLLLALGIETRRAAGLLSALGVLWLVPYAALVSVAYTSQYTLLPRLLAGGDQSAALGWYFVHPNSVPYFLDLLGYTFYGLSGLAIGYRLLGDTGIARAAGVLLWLAAITAILGFAGYAAGIPALEFLITVSGAISLPFGLVVAYWGTRYGLPADG